MAGKQKSGGGARKIGRTAEKCKYYRSRMTREKNKERKLKKHIALQSHDEVAAEALRHVWDNRGADTAKTRAVF